MRLKDKTAIVTGGSRGIGWAISKRFADEGADVCIIDINKPLDDIAEMVISRGKIQYFACDITDPEQVHYCIADINDKYCGIDVLVNNAGINTSPDTILKTEPDHWRYILDSNLTSVYLVSKCTIPFLKSNASVVNIASILGLIGVEACSAYSAAKGGIISLTRSMARDFAPNIRVNCIAPGAIETRMFIDYLKRTENPEKARSKVQQNIPLGRIGKPEDVAHAALFLASDESSWITGAILPVDGGDSC